ncbi:unnamed protein product [Leptidea sinapis]|uniref:Carboxylic ester hydrolase n=1 Tax=Leptidea sinapis TaxID=189913 RepID=A0A5E4QGW7_9NEOP|nr:unnamed protein product [Leptidea sinapis]
MGMKWVVLWSLWAARLVRQPSAPVLVSSGWLRGSVAADGSHVSYHGIPYAATPRRFKSAGPAPSWLGTFEAIEENIRCHQRISKTLVVGKEDCLTLNVYTSIDTVPDSKVPVMVFIHGGGYYDGSGTKFMYGPKYLVSKGVILVTINYRLNIQGFLCLRTKYAPGNAGMKDQVAALKWVKRNIKSFGGDPDNVTIFGESAGASSVSLHILSPMSKGLFSKAIMQSGSSLSSWAMQYRPVYMTSLLTKTMGYDTEDPQQLYDILMSKSDAELIVTRVPRKEGNIIISECLYVPCVEEIIDGEEQFLTELPYEILRKGSYNRVPKMIGSNSHEGYLFASMENDTMLPKIVLEKSLPKDLDIPSQKEREVVANKLYDFYFGDKVVSRDTLIELSRVHGEVYFIYPVLEETELHSKTNYTPVYSYVFQYSGNRNFVKKASGFGNAPGATHADDLFYIFNLEIAPTFFENNMIERMTTMWTNFAKFGEPIPTTSSLLPVKWDPVNKSSPHSFIIDEQFSTTPLWSSESARYLKKVYSKYRRRKYKDL